MNARSILPLIPAAGILLAQRLESAGLASSRVLRSAAAAALFASAFVSLWVARADAHLANAGWTAANRIHSERLASQSSIHFEGHWGFQYYMEQLGAKPADLRNSSFQPGDIIVIPENATNSFGPPPGFALAGAIMEIDLPDWLATMSQPMGAGFYASVWGPLPFAAGPVPPERYLLAHLVPLPGYSVELPMIPRR